MDSVKQNLEMIVGKEWVSDDPVILLAYGRDISSLSAIGGGFVPQRAPDYVVVPETTEQVAKVVQVANANKIPVVAATTGANVTSTNIPTRGGIRIDFKRMNKILAFDEDDMRVTLQPCVSYSMLQAEAYKRGFKTFITSAPTTGAPVGNSIFVGIGRNQNQIGMAFQQILSVTYVLADGTVVKTGSNSDGFAKGSAYWHGPGPDLTFFPVYHHGAWCVVTEMEWKVHPYDVEVRYDTKHYFFNTMKDVIEAHNELARLEFPNGLSVAPAPYYGQRYSDNWQGIERMVRAWPKFCLALNFEGTQRQVDYEKPVADEICRRWNGRDFDTLPEGIKDRMYFTENTSTKGAYCTGTTCAWSVGATRQTGYFAVAGLGELLEATEIYVKAMNEADPETAKGRGRWWVPLYLYTFNWGHCVYIEYMSFSKADPTKLDDFQEHVVRGGAAARALINNGAYGLPIMVRDDGTVGSRMGIYYEKLRAIKAKVDPNNIMNPGIGLP